MSFWARRIGELVIVLFGISLASFLMLHLTGDPAIAILGPDYTEEALVRLRQDLGLDRPLVVQYLDFLGGALRGDFGDSTRYRQPALDLFLERVPATVELTIASLLVSIVFGVTMGVLAAVFRNTGLDTVARATALIGQAIPGFFLGIVAIIIFGAQLKWLPTGGRGTIQHLILPAIALGTYYAAITARFVRGSMLEVLHSDYVRTARAKGLRRATVIIRHSLRNALIGVVTLIGLQLGNLLGGAVVIETVFSWPGVGRLAVQAIYARDFPLVQVIIMIAALIFVVVNLITDLSYRLLDPRIRVGGDA